MQIEIRRGTNMLGATVLHTRPSRPTLGGGLGVARVGRCSGFTGFVGIIEQGDFVFH